MLVSDVWEMSFGDLILQKLVERNVDPDVVSYVSNNLDRACQDYDFEDPNDVTVLNNKLENLAERAEKIDDVDPDNPSAQLRSLIRILEQKH